jgi:hypothetical protein
VVCLSLGRWEIVRPRRPAGASVRPLNFTVRRRHARATSKGSRWLCAEALHPENSRLTSVPSSASPAIAPTMATGLRNNMRDRAVPGTGEARSSGTKIYTRASISRAFSDGLFTRHLPGSVGSLPWISKSRRENRH